MDNEKVPAEGAAERTVPTKAKKKPVKQTPLQEVYDWVEIFVTAITLVMLIFTFVCRMATVDGPSMTPTLLNGQQVLVWELGYTPKGGDVVICQSEPHGLDEPLVKRVIATEGQIVEIDCATWTVYVDGVALHEDYINYVEGVPMNGWDYGTAYTVPQGCVFVMGDNRNNSADSRRVSVGPIDTRLVIGKVIWRLLPVAVFGKIE